MVWVDSGQSQEESNVEYIRIQNSNHTPDDFKEWRSAMNVQSIYSVPVLRSVSAYEVVKQLKLTDT